MKSTSLVSLFVVLFFSTLDAQSSCENCNTFYNNPAHRASLDEVSIKSGGGRTFLFDQEKVAEKDGLNFIEGLVNGPNQDFIITTTEVSSIDPSITHYRYQAFVDGIEVEGSGYALSVANAGGPTGPVNPCLRLVRFTPYIFSVSKNKNSTPSINKGQVPQLIAKEFKSADYSIKNSVLVFAKLKNRSHERSLAWKVSTYSEGKNHLIYIDATSAKVIKKVVADDHVQFPTADYGTQDLDFLVSGNNYVLTSPDERVVTYNLTRTSVQDGSIFDPSWIPTMSVNNSAWPIDNFEPELSGHLYQTHYVMQSLIDPYEDIGIVFDKIHTRAESATNTASIPNSPLTEAFIRAGSFLSNQTNNRVSIATFDVMAHELGHSFIRRHFTSAPQGGSTLHEGISDLYGYYMDYAVQGSTDWILGNDGTELTTTTRSVDAANHPFPCFDNIPNCDDTEPDNCQYDRSGPIVTWFYTVSEGNPDEGISAISIENAILVVTEAVRTMDVSELTIVSFKDATLSVAEENYGLCSVEYTTIAKSWNFVCVEDNPSCEFTISGPTQLCGDKLNSASFQIEDPLPNTVYRWSYPPEWEVPGATTNGTHYGNFLFVSDIPQYNSYPREFTIQVYSPTLGAQFIEYKRVRLIDCSGGSCKSERVTSQLEGDDKRIQDYDVTRVDVYDLTGRKIYSGSSNSSVQNGRIQSIPHGVYIYTFFDDRGNFLGVEKRVIVR